MSKQSELYALRHSFSGDSPVTAHNRSGDSEGDGAERWNFIASVQSAEADIIDEEERAEQQEAKRKFAKLLGLYFKKILTPIEYEFLKECLKGELTPHKVGLKLGINYIQFIINIKAKNIANKQKFLLLIQYSGYDFRHGLEFLPKLEQKYKDYVRTQNWYYSNRERALINSAEWKRLHPDRVKIHKHNAYLVRKSKGKIKKWPYTEAKRLYQKRYRLENKEKIREQRKAYRARSEIKQKDKERLRKWQQEHKERACLYSKRYRQKHPEKQIEQNIRRRIKRAEKKQQN